jgi:immune inhibitor A
MRKPSATSLLAGTAIAALAAGLAQLPASAAQTSHDGGASAPSARSDDRPGPFSEQQQHLRQAAVAALVSGKATKQARAGGGSTVTLSGGKSVEFFDNSKQARVLTFLAEFGDTVVGKYGGTPGPAHNNIPEPDRTKDNSTLWEPDFDVAHYDELFNGPAPSFRHYYSTISTGKFTTESTTEDWVKVPYNKDYYGANPREDEGGAWDFIGDTANAWYSAQVAKGVTPAEIDAKLAHFDVWDRYDQDGDGNFNEADGYIDHFQAVHAGIGEETGNDPNAIWSHRWYDYNGVGTTGPTVNGTQVPFGGAQIGSSKYWIGDYTVEPENGDLGVFAHEFGHDLGLPDFYDTAGGENGTAFWTIMSSGSYLSPGDGEGLGSVPGGMGPDERLQLGWLDYVTVGSGRSSSVTLGAAGAASVAGGTHQAVVVPLPPKTRSTTYTTPNGGHAWWSGRGDKLTNTLQRPVAAASAVTVTASAWYDIEQDYDYLYGEYSLDNGATWKSAGRPITGSSNGWSGVRFSYKAAGKASLFRFRYATDDSVNEPGAFLDDIVVKGTTTTTDSVENGNAGWTAQGWKISTGTESVTSPRRYLLENRAYVGYDASLRTGAYQFSNLFTKPDWVQYFAFRDGLLVWFSDDGVDDNNTSEHPGEGQALVVDARPAPFSYPDGTRPSNRRQPFDAVFGLKSITEQCLTKEVQSGTKSSPTYSEVKACAPANAGKPTFSDSDPDAYWSSANPQNSVKVAGVGVTATVTGQSGSSMTVKVTNP